VPAARGLEGAPNEEEPYLGTAEQARDRTRQRVKFSEINTKSIPCECKYVRTSHLANLLPKTSWRSFNDRDNGVASLHSSRDGDRNGALYSTCAPGPITDYAQGFSRRASFAVYALSRQNRFRRTIRSITYPRQMSKNKTRSWSEPPEPDGVLGEAFLSFRYEHQN